MTKAGIKAMKFDEAIERYVRHKLACGQFTSDRTTSSYARCIQLHAEDCARQGHPLVRDADEYDVLATLGRWTNTTTKRNRYAILNGFYRWTRRAGTRADDPMVAIDPPRRKRPNPMFLTDHEIEAILHEGRRLGGTEWWATELLIGAGLRNAEVRGLRREHLARHEWVHVTADIAKGGTERWVPIPASVQAAAAEAVRMRRPKEYILASRQTVDVGVRDPRMREDPTRPMSPQAIMRLVTKVAERAGVHVNVTPHRFRHYFGRAITEEAGAWLAQEALGHADIGTTVEYYAGRPTLEQLERIREIIARRTNPPTPTGLSA